MRAEPWVVALLVLAGCMAAKSGEAGPAAASAGLLRGLVVDEAIRPLPGVNVTVSAPGRAPLAHLTDAQGLFRFDGLAPGSYALSASKARYLSVQTVTQVVADDGQPPLVQLVLAQQVDQTPYVIAIKWEGYIGCAFTYGNLCSVPAQGGFDLVGDQSAHLFWHEYVDVQRAPDLIQAEAVWDATLATSEELQPIFGYSRPDQWVQFQYDGTFDGNDTRSPSYYRLTGARAGAVGLGITEGLVVEFYSGGNELNPTGLTVEQPIRLFLHNFYGYVPPDAWRFVTDGAPPPP